MNNGHEVCEFGLKKRQYNSKENKAQHYNLCFIYLESSTYHMKIIAIFL